MAGVIRRHRAKIGSCWRKRTRAGLSMPVPGAEPEVGHEGTQGRDGDDGPQGLAAVLSPDEALAGTPGNAPVAECELSWVEAEVLRGSQRTG